MPIRQWRSRRSPEATSSRPNSQIELLWAYFLAKQQGNPNVLRLRNRIAERNLLLVRKVAHKFAKQCPEPYEDLEQIGQTGLLKAIEKFDPSRCVAFSSFAVPYIEGAIRHFLRDHWSSVKVPRRAVELHSRIRRNQRRLKVLGRDLTEMEVATCLGVPEEKWRWVVEALERKPLVDLADIEEAVTTPETELADDTGRVYQYLGKIPNPHRACLIAHYFGNLSNAAIAAQQGISQAAVEELLEEGLYWLRCQLEANCG